MSDNPTDYELFHYGVKGMKWGVIRKAASAVASADHKRVETAKKVNSAVKSGVKKAAVGVKTNKVYSIDNAANNVKKGSKIVTELLKSGAGKIVAADLKRIETANKVNSAVGLSVKTGLKKAASGVKSNSVYSIDNVTKRFGR